MRELGEALCSAEPFTFSRIASLARCNRPLTARSERDMASAISLSDSPSRFISMSSRL